MFCSVSIAAEFPELRETRHAERCDVDWFYLKCCAKCGGDLAFDEGDWLCVQCGTYFYTDLYCRPDKAESPLPHLPPPPEEGTRAKCAAVQNVGIQIDRAFPLLDWLVTAEFTGPQVFTARSLPIGGGGVDFFQGELQ